MREIKPPNDFLELQGHRKRFRLFLAGSIEMGKAEDWQTKLVTELAEYNIDILNPRRDDWDSSWEQSIDNPKFKEQVEWELLGLEKADLVALYFAKDTKSPISLLELGLFARSNKFIVYCPRGFWRKGNVDVVCERYGVVNTNNLGDFVCEIKERLEAI